MDIRRFVIPAFVLSAFVIAGGCMSGGSPPAPQSPAVLTPAVPQSGAGQAAGSAETFSLSVDSLSAGAVLPDVYTCRGASTSPQVSWKGIPAATKSLVLIVDDPDAPNGIFTHWLVYNIPPADGEIAQGQTSAKTLDNEAQQGEGSSGFRGYYPPCPPVGSTHRYIFRLYASDQYFSLPTADRAAIDNALAGHTLAKTEIVTTFTR